MHRFVTALAGRVVLAAASLRRSLVQRVRQLRTRRAAPPAAEETRTFSTPMSRKVMLASIANASRAGVRKKSWRGMK
jgi:hypothetical protein